MADDPNKIPRDQIQWGTLSPVKRCPGCGEWHTWFGQEKCIRCFANMKKNHFKQRIPNWADSCNPLEFDFTTQDELLGHDKIAYWSRETAAKGRKFVRYSVALSGVYGSHKSTLMAEFDDGRWWLIGYLDHLDNITLPIWCPSNKTLEEVRAEHETRMQSLRDIAAKAKQDEIDKAARLLLKNGFGVYKNGMLAVVDKKSKNTMLYEYLHPSYSHDGGFTYEYLDEGEALDCVYRGTIYDGDERSTTDVT